LIPRLEGVQAHDQLAKAWRLVAIAHAITLERGREAEAAERSIAHAREAGDERLEARITAGYTNALRDGPTPVPEAIERCRAIIDRRLSNRQAEAVVRASLAMLLAMNEQLEDARDEYAAAIELLADLGGALPALAAVAAAKIELAVGNFDAVIQELRPAYVRLGELGEHYFRPVVGSLLAFALEQDDQSAEARALVEELTGSTDPSDVEAWSVLHAVRAKQLATDGDYDEAIAAARLAGDVVADADAPVVQANALVILAEVAEAAGEPALAREARSAATERYVAKADAAALNRLGVRASEPV
jgi:tetratricopeptide (TPR) repeat protein